MALAPTPVTSVYLAIAAVAVTAILAQRCRGQRGNKRKSSSPFPYAAIETEFEGGADGPTTEVAKLKALHEALASSPSDHEKTSPRPEKTSPRPEKTSPTSHVAAAKQMLHASTPTLARDASLPTPPSSPRRRSVADPSSPFSEAKQAFSKPSADSATLTPDKARGVQGKLAAFAAQESSSLKKESPSVKKTWKVAPGGSYKKTTVVGSGPAAKKTFADLP